MRTIILPAGKDVATGEGMQLILNFKDDPDSSVMDGMLNVKKACEEIVKTAPSDVVYALVTGLVVEMRNCNMHDRIKWVKVLDALREI